MEIRNLLTFVQVAELGSFTRAAKMLGYSQSTISFQIKQLENELDCLLFERINHTVTLTEKGREVLSYAQKIDQLTVEFRQQLTAPQSLKGHIHIVTSDSIGEMMLRANYSDFFSRYPHISLKFSNADTDGMFRMLDRNEADVMFTLDRHIYQANYIIAKEERVPVHFVTSAASPLARRTLTLQELINEPFLLTERGMGYRRDLDEALGRQSLSITPALETGRTDLITALLKEGAGVSFLPDFVTQKKVDEGTLAYITVSDFSSDVWKQLLYHRNKWISQPFRVFLDYVMRNEFNN